MTTRQTTKETKTVTTTSTVRSTARPAAAMSRAPLGHVSFVGAGPGDEGLLTVRAAELLARADVVITELPEHAALVTTSAEIVDGSVGADGAGEKGAALTPAARARLVVRHAKAGAHVVRLIAGDPFTYSTGPEEALACAKAGIGFEVLGGVVPVHRAYGERARSPRRGAHAPVCPEREGDRGAHDGTARVHDLHPAPLAPVELRPGVRENRGGRAVPGGRDGDREERHRRPQFRRMDPLPDPPGVEPSVLAILSTVLLAFYGLAAFVAIGNAVGMVRPRREPDGPEIAFCIPARDEADNLRELLPQLLPQGRVLVFDDESSDGTGDVARSLGATVLTPREALPKGWTGKNRACHELGLAAPGEYLCFLDADVRVTPDFADRLRSLMGPERVVTGFPTIVHGAFPEPVVLGWVGWSLLALNPFFLVRIAGKGHNRFTNGQVDVWPTDLYRRLRPNEALKGRILEDVLIGRLLAKHGVPVVVANLAAYMRVAMYQNWRQAYDGMSKNSYEITGSAWGNFALAALLLLLGWGWLLTGPVGLLLLLLSALATTLTVRGKPAVRADLPPLAHGRERGPRPELVVAPHRPHALEGPRVRLGVRTGL